MPYIKQNVRDDFMPHIIALSQKLGHLDPLETPDCPNCQAMMKENAAKGELNFIITTLVSAYIRKHGLKYHRLQDFICGVLGSSQHELLRRLQDEYEDHAIAKNGDLPEFTDI